MIESGYNSFTINSHFVPYSGERDIFDQIELFSNAKAVAWYFDKIVFYSIVNSVWVDQKVELKYLVRLRLFNKDKELHVWRSNRILKARIRVDNDGPDVLCVDAMPVLNGTHFISQPTGIEATEEKGTRYFLPYPELKIPVHSERIRLLTRNYIGWDEIEQAGYIDSRFLDFITL